jgi:hypothetical protein
MSARDPRQLATEVTKGSEPRLTLQHPTPVIPMRRALLFASLLAACSNSPGEEPEATARTAALLSAPQVPFATRLLEIAADYKPGELEVSRAMSSGLEHDWTRLGDGPAWAPSMCRSPPPPGPLVSDSRDGLSHGRKLYFLHTRDESAYRAAATEDQPVGQAFVKESYDAVAVQEADASFMDASWSGLAVERRGKFWKLGPARDLFIMYKLDPAAPGTDEGWVYGTVSTQGLVTSSGRVASCMECHTQADRDRMFGAKAGRELVSSGWRAWAFLYAEQAAQEGNGED